MRFAYSGFDLGKEEEKQLKEVVREVFQSKPRGRTREMRRTDSRRQKVVTLF